MKNLPTLYLAAVLVLFPACSSTSYTQNLVNELRSGVNSVNFDRVVTVWGLPSFQRDKPNGGYLSQWQVASPVSSYSVPSTVYAFDYSEGEYSHQSVNRTVVTGGDIEKILLEFDDANIMRGFRYWRNTRLIASGGSLRL